MGDTSYLSPARAQLHEKASLDLELLIIVKNHLELQRLQNKLFKPSLSHSRTVQPRGEFKTLPGTELGQPRHPPCPLRSPVSPGRPRPGLACWVLFNTSRLV